MRIRFSAHRHQSIRGFTLTELAIVMGIIGLILGAIWVAAASVSSNNKLQNAQQQLAFVIANYRTAFVSRGVDFTATTADVTCDNATINGVKDGYFPPTTIKSGVTCTANTTSTYPINPWSGYYQAIADGAGQTVDIVVSSIPQDACIKFASSFPNTGDITAVLINGNNMGALPISPTTANTKCTAGANVVQVNYKAR